MKRCSKCGEVKPVEEFHREARRRDGLQLWCKACAAARKRERREADRERITAQDHAYYEANRERIAVRKRAYKAAHRERVLASARAWREANHERLSAAGRQTRAALHAIKVESGCVDCGTTEGRLDFDHRDGEVKLFKVADATGCSRDRLFAEIAKCDVRCASCHTRRHNLDTGEVSP